MLSWKSLVSKINQPLPLSARGAEKLYWLLQTSFQRHLDRRHPSISERSKTATQIHINSILAAPHFNNVSKRRPAIIPPLDQDSRAMSVNHLLAKFPMTYFGDCVSSGTATREIAIVCLESELRKALALPDLKIHDNLKLVGGGTTVLKWLHSCSQGESLAFLVDYRLLKVLIPFLIAEGKESLVWEWLQELKTHCILRSRSKGSQLAIRNIQRSILFVKFRFEITLGPGLEFAIGRLSLTAKDIYFLCGHSTLDDLIGYFINNLGRAFSRTASNGESIDLMIQIIDKWQTDPLYRRSLAELYRTEGPGIASALTLLQEYPTKDLPTDNDRRRQDLISLSFGLAKLLLRDGSDTAVTSATWVMGFLQDHFAKEIGYTRKEKSIKSQSHKRPNSDEAFHLRLLDALSGRSEIPPVGPRDSPKDNALAG